MKCPQQNNQWCAYQFGGRCHVDDWYEDKSGCIGPQLTPLWQDSNEILAVIDMKELQAQIDICEIVIKSAVPKDPHDRIQLSETAQVREYCGIFLHQIESYNRVKQEVEDYEQGNREDDGRGDAIGVAADTGGEVGKGESEESASEDEESGGRSEGQEEEG